MALVFHFAENFRFKNVFKKLKMELLKLMKISIKILMCIYLKYSTEEELSTSSSILSFQLSVSKLRSNISVITFVYKMNQISTILVILLSADPAFLDNISILCID